MMVELGQWDDGSIRLALWDSMHGNDRVFVLLADGTARESDREEVETLTPIDLIAVLRAMALE